VVFIEGCLKPVVLSNLIGKSSFVVGAVGGQFGSSTKTLHEMMQFFQTVGVTKFILAADAGWDDNDNVIREYTKLLSIMHEYNVNFEILDTGTDKDADEIDPKLAKSLYGGKSSRDLWIQYIHW